MVEIFFSAKQFFGPRPKPTRTKPKPGFAPGISKNRFLWHRRRSFNYQRRRQNICFLLRSLRKKLTWSHPKTKYLMKSCSCVAKILFVAFRHRCPKLISSIRAYSKLRRKLIYHFCSTRLCHVPLVPSL